MRGYVNQLPNFSLEPYIGIYRCALDEYKKKIKVAGRSVQRVGQEEDPLFAAGS